MDRNDLEPRDGMFKDFSGVQILLCRGNVPTALCDGNGEVQKQFQSDNTSNRT